MSMMKSALYVASLWLWQKLVHLVEVSESHYYNYYYYYLLRL